MWKHSHLGPEHFVCVCVFVCRHDSWNKQLICCCFTRTDRILGVNFTQKFILNLFHNWQSPDVDRVDTFMIPWEKFPEELMQSLERGKRPYPKMRREMVRIMVSEMMQKMSSINKRSSTEVNYMSVPQTCAHTNFCTYCRQLNWTFETLKSLKQYSNCFVLFWLIVNYVLRAPTPSFFIF